VSNVSELLRRKLEIALHFRSFSKALRNLKGERLLAIIEVGTLLAGESKDESRDATSRRCVPDPRLSPFPDHDQEPPSLIAFQPELSDLKRIRVAEFDLAFGRTDRPQIMRV